MKDFILKGIIPGFFRVLCLAINIVILFNSLVFTVPLNLESAVKIEIIKLLGIVILSVINYEIFKHLLIGDLFKTLWMFIITVIIFLIFTFC